MGPRKPGLTPMDGDRPILTPSKPWSKGTPAAQTRTMRTESLDDAYLALPDGSWQRVLAFFAEHLWRRPPQPADR